LKEGQLRVANLSRKGKRETEKEKKLEKKTIISGTSKNEGKALNKMGN